jgi:hypothetical protein
VVGRAPPADGVDGSPAPRYRDDVPAGPDDRRSARRSRPVRLTGLNALVDAVLRFAIVRVVDAFLAEVDVTALVREHVDLDVVASGIDVDKVVSRVDLDAIVRRIDIDAIAVGLDVDAVVARVDLDAIVRRIDIDAIARGLDLDAVVARVDLEAVVRRIDLDAIAGELDVDAVVARVDLDAIVRRMDLIGIASEVVDGIDLAGIIRQSSGALASDSVRTIRSEAMHADDVLSGVVDRVLGRRRPRPDVGTVR